MNDIIRIEEGEVPVINRAELPQTDLDAAWAWFRESGCLLMPEIDPGMNGPRVYGWRAYEPRSAEPWDERRMKSTRDGAVLAAWRAATKQNNENKEKGEG